MQMNCAYWNAINYCSVLGPALHLFVSQFHFFKISHICYALWILLWNICTILLVPFIIIKLNATFGIFILYLCESHNYIFLGKIILQTLWKLHVVSSGFSGSWEFVLLGGCCVSWKTSSQAFFPSAPRGKFPGATELLLYCFSVSLHIFIFTIFFFVLWTLLHNNFYNQQIIPHLVTAMIWNLVLWSNLCDLCKRMNRSYLFFLGWETTETMIY